MRNYPTAWQRRVLWTVYTYLGIVAGGAVAVYLIVLFGHAIGFLQPVLIPFALAAVLAFLLEPIVRTITSRTRLSRTLAVLVVFTVILLLVALLGVAVVPRIYQSTVKMVEGMPEYTQKAQQRLVALVDATGKRLERFNHLFPAAKPLPSPAPGNLSPGGEAGKHPAASDNSAKPDSSAGPQAGTSPAAAPQENSSPAQSDAAKDPSQSPVPDDKGAKPNPGNGTASSVHSLTQPNGLSSYIEKQVPALEARIPAVVDSLLHLLIKSVGAAGALLDLIIIPVYLYFLLVESRNIARHWNEYLPIRDSPFKKEVVSVLLEINGYLVAFFRGQLIVSTIDGILIGGSLYFFVGLDFSFFIGLLVVVLTFIPYLGIILCYIPVILVAIVQYGDFGHPLAAVAIMFAVQTLESTIISPKIVGDSVGLHPVTVIFSVFGWSLLLNGPIGAILAVPLTATVKVLLRRYIWEMSGRGHHLVPLGPASVATLEDVNRQAEEASQGKHDADGPRRASFSAEGRAERVGHEGGLTPGDDTAEGAGKLP